MLLWLLLYALFFLAVKSSDTTVLTVTHTTSTTTVSLPHTATGEPQKVFCGLLGVVPVSAGKTGEACEWDKTDSYKYVEYGFTVDLVTSVVETGLAMEGLASALAGFPDLSLPGLPPSSSAASLPNPLPASAAQTSQAASLPTSQAGPSVTTGGSIQAFLVTSEYTSLVSTPTDLPSEAGGGILTLTSTHKFVASGSTVVAPRYVRKTSRRLCLKGCSFWIVCTFSLFLVAGT
jgi:hypothetical protein